MQHTFFVLSSSLRLIRINKHGEQTWLIRAFTISFHRQESIGRGLCYLTFTVSSTPQTCLKNLSHTQCWILHRYSESRIKKKPLKLPWSFWSLCPTAQHSQGFHLLPSLLICRAALMALLSSCNELQGSSICRKDGCSQQPGITVPQVQGCFMQTFWWQQPAVKL